MHLFRIIINLFPMTKTIENLKAAITGESTASATYAAYAAKAAQDGQPLIQ